MEDRIRRRILEAAYSRIRERLQAKDVTVEHLRNAALDALARARVQMEIDPVWVEEELIRLQSKPESDPEPGPDGSSV
jgi:hypothetical protein